MELAGADNATIALAREAVRASLAQQLQARALALPSLDAGASLNEHWGNLQSSGGVIEDVQRQALYFGNGAGAIGAGTVDAPGVRLVAHVADALFAPVSAREEVSARRFEAASVRNSILLDVVNAYFELIGAEAKLTALHQSQGEVGEVARITANWAKAEAGRRGDADRAQSEALLLQLEERQAQEEAVTAAAELARLLNIDPSARLHGPGGDLPSVELVNSDVKLERLLEIAVSANPVIAALSAEIAAAEARWRQEQVRPLVPLLAVGFSAGQFGGGGNQTDVRFGHFDGRSDFDAVALWTLENFGFGNRAVQRQRRAELDARFAARLEAVDQVRREAAEAVADAAARRQAIGVARKEMATASASYREDLLRIRNKEGRPIEVLISANQLATARLNFIRAIIEHDIAQFRLFVALGQAPVGW